MKPCPRCGYKPPAPTMGRPKKLDDSKILKLRRSGKSLATIAEKFQVTRGAVQAALKRSAK